MSSSTHPLDAINETATSISALKAEISTLLTDISKSKRVPELRTGLCDPSFWDINADRQRQMATQPLQIARVIQVLPRPKIPADASSATAPTSNRYKPKFTIEIKHIGKYVVNAHSSINPDDVQEGMRVGIERIKYSIKKLLPPKIDAQVKLMEVENKPLVTYEDIGGCAEQLEKIKEIVELPMTDPSKFLELGIGPPKGVLLYGPPGTGKTLLAKAVANRTNACFIRVIGSELVQKYVGEGSRLVREIFRFARDKGAAILFFDEIDAIGAVRVDRGDGSTNEVQRTMLQILTELDGFSPRGNIKIIMATNRPDTLDPALVRPGRIDRKIEFGLPDLEGRRMILEIHAGKMSVVKGIRWELIARLCPNASGAEIRSICTEAGMFAIREKRKAVTEEDFIKSVKKVLKEYSRFSATPKYMLYN